MLAERFQKLLVAWLDSLPASGWKGTASDLAEALETKNREQGHYAIVPWRRIGPELAAHGGTIAAAGWNCLAVRTNRERLIEFKRKRKPAAEGIQQ